MNKTPLSSKPAPIDALEAPSAVVRSWLRIAQSGSASPEVLVSMAQAPLGCRMFLESLPTSGPRETVRAFELPQRLGSSQREYRALLPPGSSGQYVPVAIVDGNELRGLPFLIDGARRTVTTEPRAAVTAFEPHGRGSAAPDTGKPVLAPPKLELIARVESDLPKFTSFGATPEGLRIAFYISGGRWNGPKIRAVYRSEGGDWVLVRKDGVAIPNARATLETPDGALLYYELTGTIDLGPDGYARGLANQWPRVAALSLVARVSTSSERWSWLNRSTLIGVGAVDLNVGHTTYDLYTLASEPSAEAQ